MLKWDFLQTVLCCFQITFHMQIQSITFFFICQRIYTRLTGAFWFKTIMQI